MTPAGDVRRVTMLARREDWMLRRRAVPQDGLYRLELMHASIQGSDQLLHLLRGEIDATRVPCRRRDLPRMDSSTVDQKPIQLEGGQGRRREPRTNRSPPAGHDRALILSSAIACAAPRNHGFAFRVIAQHALIGANTTRAPVAAGRMSLGGSPRTSTSLSSFSSLAAQRGAKRRPRGHEGTRGFRSAAIVGAAPTQTALPSRIRAGQRRF